MTDADLLRAYTATGSHPAFSQLVARHLDFVYASALRQTRSTALADDVAQTVFLHLAQHAPKLLPDTHLKSWLCVITRHKAIDAIRTEARRRQRETTASAHAAMDAPSHSARPHDPSTNSLWAEVSPAIDDALATLPESDRRTILLRFFEEKSLREIGELLSLTEDTAQKRLTRALEKLRASLARRGIATTAAFLAAQLPLHASSSAPVALLTTLSSPAFFATAAATTSASTVGLINLLVMTATKKTVLITALSLAFIAVVFETAILASQNQHLAASEQALHQLLTESASLQRDLARREKLARESTTPLPTSPAAADQLETRLHSIMDDVKTLQRAFTLLPEEQIPELRFLTESDWIAVATEYDLKTGTTTRFDTALSQVRNKARHRFTPLLSAALKKHLLSNNDLLPSNTLVLLPYFDPPIDPSILSRYEMVRTGTGTEAGLRSPVIREKESNANGQLDTLSEIALFGTRSTYVKSNRESRLTPEIMANLGLEKSATTKDRRE